jgi:hypothetical protein
MATAAQIKANRQNAKKSTGPKTDEGKAAVSQNAVKNGLFTGSIITGETEAEYAAFHGEVLAELDPRGVMELLLAERVVSLWWRLIRAERMQNQAIEDMIVLFVTNNTSRSCREYHIRDHGLRPGDPGFDLDGLPLGRIGNKDFANCRILDRMLLYERRIESSLNRTMNELKSHKKIRRSERQDAGKEQASPNQAILKAFEPSALNRETYADPLTRRRERQTSEYWDRVAMRQMEAEERSKLEKQLDLLKQSQFPVDDIDIKAFLKIAYGDNEADEAEENKAKKACSFGKLRTGSEQSQMGQLSACGLSDEAGKGGKSASAATG